MYRTEGQAYPNIRGLNMAQIKTPYTLNVDSTSITASSDATDTISIGNNETIEVHKIILTSATGIFDLEITDQNGFAYQQEAVRYSATFNDNRIIELPIPLILEPGTVWKFKFTDASSATNRVRMQLWGIRTIT